MSFKKQTGATLPIVIVCMVSVAIVAMAIFMGVLTELKLTKQRTYEDAKEIILVNECYEMMYLISKNKPLPNNLEAISKEVIADYQTKKADLYEIKLTIETNLTIGLMIRQKGEKEAYLAVFLFNYDDDKLISYQIIKGGMTKWN